VKDFDIATSAHPQEIKNLFRNCRLIGRRFRLAHVLFRDGKVIEVSTFRKQTGFSDEVDLLIKSDNTFGTPEEDARRRDFTINGLFYSITDFSVIDYVGGLDDLKRKLIRTIGEPNIRLREDPIRTLRGIRLAARLGFAIDGETRRAMTAHREEIWKCATPRIVDEFVRMLNQGAAAASFPLLADLDMLQGLLPGFAKAYADPAIRAEVQRDLESLDAHQKPQGGLPPGLALAVLYYPIFASTVAAAGADADRGRIAAAMLDADLERLKFPRAQLEKAVLLLAAQQRLTQPLRRRGRGGSVASRPWFAEALTLFEITQADTPEGRATLRRLRSQLHRAPAERRPAEKEAAASEGPAGPEESAAASEQSEETGRAGTGRRRRRSRRGKGRGRGRREESGVVPEEGGELVLAADLQPAPQAPPQPHRRMPPPPEQDRPIDPDAAFGDGDTDLEPPGGESAEERTD
jgi:poly(A) polymerase